MINSVFIFICSEIDVTSALLTGRFPSLSHSSEFVTFFSDGKTEVRKNATELKRTDGVKAVLMAPDFLNSNACIIMQLLKEYPYSGVFMHPGKVSSPNRGHVGLRLNGLNGWMSNATEEDRLKVLHRTVAFSIDNKTVTEFNGLWDWLYNPSLAALSPCPTAEDLKKIYRRLFHRQALAPLFSVRIQLEGLKAESLPNALRLVWAKKLRTTLKSDAWVWLQQEASLSATCMAFLAQVDSDNPELHGIAAAANEFSKVIQVFAANTL